MRGVFATTGGEGGYRIAPRPDSEAARAGPQPFVGFSDILVSGHFDSISRAVGRSLPSLDDAILLLEDHHGTGLGQIDRCLAQLSHAGLLRNLRGIAPGTFGELETTTASQTTLTDVLSDSLTPLGVPILGGLPIGEGRNPASAPLGTTATIDVTAGSLTVAPGLR